MPDGSNNLVVNDEKSITPITLLSRLRHGNTDQAAWGEFVDRYGRKVLHWCRRWGLQEADAQDVTQNVLLALAQQMRSFEYDATGSFRAWLKTVAFRAWGKFLEQRRRGGAENAKLPTGLDSLPAQDELARQIEEEGEREVLEAAMERVRERVQPHTWEAFRLLAIEGISGAEAAQKLDVPIGSVWVAKSNVLKMLREEAHRLGLTD